MKWVPDNWSEEGWYEIEREPDRLAGEYLEFSVDLKTIVIKKREKTPEQIAAEEKAAADALLFTPAVVVDLKARLEKSEDDLATTMKDLAKLKAKLA